MGDINGRISTGIKKFIQLRSTHCVLSGIARTLIQPAFIPHMEKVWRRFTFIYLSYEMWQGDIHTTHMWLNHTFPSVALAKSLGIHVCLLRRDSHKWRSIQSFNVYAFNLRKSWLPPLFSSPVSLSAGNLVRKILSWRKIVKASWDSYIAEEHERHLSRLARAWKIKL